MSGEALEDTYNHILRGLASQPGVLGSIYRGAQNKISNPSHLKTLIVDYIDKENWSAAGADVNGDAYEELLERSAGDTKSTAGQYFTPRALIQAMVEVVQPTIDDTVVDPACGTGGFLLAAHSYVSKDAASFTPPQREHLRTKFVTGVDIGATTSRLASMNLLLHGLGSITGDSLIDSRDALVADPGERWSVVLANPPFGRSSSSDIGGADDDGAEIFRQDFVVTTSNKQLNFLQHIMTILDINGRAAVVLPDNVLFEGGAGETLRRKLLSAFDFHTLVAAADRDLLQARREGERAVLRQEARGREPVDAEAVGLRPAHQQALHPEEEPAAPVATSTTSLTPTCRASLATSASSPSSLEVVHLRRTARARQGQPRHHLAPRRVSRRHRQPPSPRDHRPRDRRGSDGRAWRSSRQSRGRWRVGCQRRLTRPAADDVSRDRPRLVGASIQWSR